ncbi:MAG: pyridoxal-phosphate dependent enzyme [Gemmatimonadales bacterium]|nr:MAG: pyridoxal-phosphate dependent enzyme [Gemmatimonadales bacterium]
MPEVELITVDREPRAESVLVTLDEIRAAADRIAPVIVRTPFLASRLRLPGSEHPRSIWLKCESLQHAGAFKLRGAYNFISCMSAAERSRGIVTYSSGNHAQGVAWSARELGLSATVVMPVDAPSVKREAVLEMGALVELIGTTTIERQARAEEIVAAGGGVMVPPFDHPLIIAGQGTVGLEIIDQLAAMGRLEAGLVLVPIGGGGLIAGVAAAIRRLSPHTRIVGVEPEGAPKMRKSLDAGHPVTLSSIDTIADGLKPVRPGELTFAHVKHLVDEVVTVTDESIRDAVLWCYRRRLVVEPSGAASLAGLLAGRVPLADSGETIAILSGGNLDPALLQQWVAEENSGG